MYYKFSTENAENGLDLLYKHFQAILYNTQP